jgi:hypothetical protein
MVVAYFTVENALVFISKFETMEKPVLKPVLLDNLVKICICPAFRFFQALIKILFIWPFVLKICYKVPG